MFSFSIDQNITLRQFEQRHNEVLFNFFINNSVHLSLELDWLAQPFTRGDVSEYIQAGLNRFATNNGFRAGIWQGTQLAGCISLHGLDWENKNASIGYWLGYSFVGHGIITKACTSIIDHAIVELNLERIEIKCAIDNFRSRRVAERLGFIQEGVLRRSWLRRGEFVDQILYSLLPAEWEQHKATHLTP